MALMTKMRDSMPVIMIGLAVLFMITIVFDWGMGYLGLKGEGQDPVIGIVNGQNIKFQEFNKIVNTARENQKFQTGKDIEEDQMEGFRGQVWDAYVNQILIEQQIKKFNIQVTDEEVKNVLEGENPPEFLKKSFIDSTGNFNRAAYLRAIKDPRNAEPLTQAKELIKQQQVQEKLQAVVTSSVVIPERDLVEKFKEQNLKAEAEFVLFGLNTIPDNQVVVSDDDLNKYYNAHLDQYKVEAQRKFKYVMFRDQASKSDSESVYKNILRIKDDAEKDFDFKKLIASFSSKPYSETAIRPGTYPKEAENLLFNAKTGTVVGPVPTYEGFALFKVLRDTVMKEEFVSASHILINFANNGNDTAKALAKAKDLLQKVKSGADFASIAMANSDDPGSGRLGGDVGYFTKGQMVPEFEKAAFAAKPGEIVGPVKTTYGYHIIKGKGKLGRLPIAAELLNSIKISSSSREELYTAATDFHYNVTKNGQDFEKEAQSMKFQVLETQSFSKESDFVPGIGVSKHLSDFAFDNSINSISEVTRVVGAYVIAKVTEIIPDGVKKLDEVKESVKQMVIKEKKMEKLLEKAKIAKGIVKSGEGLSVLTAKDSTVRVMSTGSFNYGQFIGAGVGRDFAFNFTAFRLKPGEISEPVKGANGSYLIQLKSKNSFDQKGFDSQKQALRNQLTQEKKSNYFNSWVMELKKKAEIEDFRNKFFRY